MIKMGDYTVQDDNILLYEIEKNDAFAVAEHSEEELERLDQLNAEFETAVIKQTIVQRAISDPCSCYRNAIASRSMRQKFHKPGEAGPVVTQKDIDNYVNGVIVVSENGVDKNMVLYARQCTRCKSIQLYGDIRPLMRGLGQMYCDHLDMLDDDPAAIAARKEEALKNAKYVMEDIETGEKVPADSIGEALFGAPDPNLMVEDIEPEE